MSQGRTLLKAPKSIALEKLKACLVGMLKFDGTVLFSFYLVINIQS
jgi:hypothetical protein